MTEFVRTPTESFAQLEDYQFSPHYHQWADLRMHYVDEGPRDGPVMLMVHGMPAWSYLYRDFIAPLVAAGYRCIAPDHLGFGKSDKPTDPHWYSIARHTEVLSSLITELDLSDITLVCQDWGGPIGLAQAMTMPERFSRLVIMNTWLHHPDFQYSEAIKRWSAGWQEGGLFSRPKPDVGALVALTGHMMSRDAAIATIATDAEPVFTDSRGASLRDAYNAPFAGVGAEGCAGLPQFPLSIPFAHYARGNGAAQTRHFELLKSWTKPIDFIWGGADDIFTEAWGRQWAAGFSHASFHAIPEAGHFLQNTHAAEIVSVILERAA